MGKFVKLASVFGKDGSLQHKFYPIIFPNEFWNLKEHNVPVNSTTKTLPLKIDVYPLSFMKFQIYASMEEGMRKQAEQPGPFGQTTSTSDFEELKRMMLETNPVLLGTTMVVSMLHSLFEFLAFKNDISHWRNKKDNVGVSVRTILSNVVMQTIIFLYLMDNNEETSWLILIGQGFGILLEFWKITKAVNVRVVKVNSVFPYRIKLENKHELSETEKDTQTYDKEAFYYMYWVAGPLLIAYSLYSLYYQEHKGWYSFTISTLVGFVYTWGFLMMVPSLYINYKLRSVAHMPRKAMVYKFLNTIVDDLFSFCIRMPFLHRLACFRDDVIFVIYIFQMYKYKVDKSRVNEYGHVEEEEKPKDDKEVKEITKNKVEGRSTAIPAKKGLKKR